MKTKKLLSILTILLSINLTFAQSGDLDSTFDPGTGLNNIVLTTAIQKDGKIIIGGFFTSVNGTPRNRIARLNTDGSLDTTFNPGTGSNSRVMSISIQSDDKIIIAGGFTAYNGTSRTNIARLNTDGSLDHSFDPGFGANDWVQATSIQSDGKIIYGGDFTLPRNRIARLNTDGSLDTSFNMGVNSRLLTISIQNDGKIIIGGYFTSANGNRILRLNTDGSIDNSFNPGTGANNRILSSFIQNDGKIIIGGSFTSFNGIARNHIARLNSDGSLDNSFVSGLGADTSVETIAVQSDNKIIIGGSFTSYNGTPINRIARLNSDGSLDNTFDPGTGAGNIVYTTSIQSDGKIIIGGEFTSYNGTPRNNIARINATGASTIVPIHDKNESRFNIFPNPFSSNTTLQSGQSINDGTLTIYNTLGEVVSHITKINGQSVTINRGNLANGLYFIRLTEGKHELMMKKVIVVD